MHFPLIETDLRTVCLLFTCCNYDVNSETLTISLYMMGVFVMILVTPQSQEGLARVISRYEECNYITPLGWDVCCRCL